MKQRGFQVFGKKWWHYRINFDIFVFLRILSKYFALLFKKQEVTSFFLSSFHRCTFFREVWWSFLFLFSIYFSGRDEKFVQFLTTQCQILNIAASTEGTKMGETDIGYADTMSIALLYFNPSDIAEARPHCYFTKTNTVRI